MRPAHVAAGTFRGPVRLMAQLAQLLHTVRRCGKGLKPGKHHVGCSGGKAAPRQAKRQRVSTVARNAGDCSERLVQPGPGSVRRAARSVACSCWDSA